MSLAVLSAFPCPPGTYARPRLLPPGLRIRLNRAHPLRLDVGFTSCQSPVTDPRISTPGLFDGGPPRVPISGLSFRGHVSSTTQSTSALGNRVALWFQTKAATLGLACISKPSSSWISPTDQLPPSIGTLLILTRVPI